MAEVNGPSETEDVDKRLEVEESVDCRVRVTLTVSASLWMVLGPPSFKMIFTLSHASLMLLSEGLGSFGVVAIIFVFGFAGRVVKAFSNSSCEMSMTCAKRILIDFSTSAGT